MIEPTQDLEIKFYFLSKRYWYGIIQISNTANEDLQM